MGLLSRLFGKRKKQNTIIIKEEKKLTSLESLFLNDLEIYDALKDTMFLYPTKIDVTFKEAILQAKKLEREDPVRAAVWYRIAGSLAIYAGDVSKVKECFGKYAKLTGRKLKILEIVEEAVKKAQEFYQKYLEEKK